MNQSIHPLACVTKVTAGKTRSYYTTGPANPAPSTT